MSILDTISDPLGTRYKKKSMSERLGISAIKRKLTKTFIQPFSRLSPSYQWKNLKRRVKSKLGYYSEPAKAYRKGNMTQAILRRMTNSDTSNCVMPFREVYDLKSNPFDRDQTGPTGKGVFKKLSAYAAPGAILGLVYASRKMKLYDKLRGKLADAKAALPHKLAGARQDLRVLVRAGKAVWRKARAYGRSRWRTWRRGTSLLTSSTTQLVGILRENTHYYVPRNNFRHDYGQQDKEPTGSSVVKGILTLGAIGAAGVGGAHIIRKLSDQKQLAINAERAFLKLEALQRRTDGTIHAMRPVMQAKTAWAALKYDAASAIAGTAGMFRHKDVIRDANKAALRMRAGAYMSMWSKVMPHLRRSKQAGAIRSLVRGYTRRNKSKDEIFTLAKRKYAEIFPKVVPNSPPIKGG